MLTRRNVPGTGSIRHGDGDRSAGDETRNHSGLQRNATYPTDIWRAYYAGIRLSHPFPLGERTSMKLHRNAATFSSNHAGQRRIGSRHTLAIAALSLSLALGLSGAAPAAFAQNAQQEKMKSCNKQAADGSMKGDQRKAFMKTCLSSKPADAPKPTQQEKMKTCNASAKGQKGDARKAFMKDCLSAH